MVHKWALLSDQDPNTTGMEPDENGKAMPTGFIPEMPEDFKLNSADFVQWQRLYTKTPPKKAYGFSNSLLARLLMRRMGLITGKIKDIFNIDIIGGVENDLSS